MADDLKVRLSAEGMADVIDAFKRVASQAHESGKEAADGFEPLKDAIGDLQKNVLGFLAFDKVLDGMKELFKTTLEGSEKMLNLSRATGLSTDAIQSLNQAAKVTGVGQDAMANGIERFSRTLGQAEAGSRQAQTAFAQMGISLQQLKDLSPDQQFQAVAKRLSEIENPAQRAAAEMAIFGKAGQQLDPVLREVGEQGLSPFLDHLKELGVYLSSDTMEQMRQANESFKDMGQQVQGIGTQILVGLVPDLQQGVDAVLKSADGISSGFQQVGHIIGTVFKTVVGIFETVGMALGDLAGMFVVIWDRTAITINNVLTDAFHMDWSKLKQDAAWGAREVVNAVKEYVTSTDINDMWSSLFSDKGKKSGEHPAGDHQSTGALINTTAGDAVARARLESLKAQLANEEKIRQAHAAITAEDEKRAYDAGKLTLQQYYDDRARLIKDKTSEEISDLAREREEMRKLPLPSTDDGSAAIKRRQDLANIDAQIHEKQLAQQLELKKNAAALAQAQQKLDDEKITAENKLAELQGRHFDVLRSNMEQEAQKLDDILAKGGVGQADRASAIEQFRAQGGAHIDFLQQTQQVNTAFAEMNLQIKQIQDKVKSGSIFPIQGEQQILEIERQQIPVLQQKAAEMERIARVSGRNDDILKAEQFRQKVDEVQASIQNADNTMRALHQTAQTAFQDGLSRFLVDVTAKGENLNKKFQQMGLSIAQSMAQITSQMLSKQALQSLIGLFNGNPAASAAAGTAMAAPLNAASGAMTMSATALSGSGMTLSASAMQLMGAAQALSAANTASSAAVFAATGGLIRGPGTATSDSIPAMLSDGEFVVKADVVGRPGMADFLHGINHGMHPRAGAIAGVPRFAEGGLVGTGGQPGGGVNLSIINVPHPELIGDYLATQEGHHQVLNIIDKNPTRVRNAIG